MLPKSKPVVENYYHTNSSFCGCHLECGKFYSTVHIVRANISNQNMFTSYNHVCLVLDIKDFYYLEGECMDCNACNSTFETWDNRMLEQLSDGVRAHFPAILTWKYACDQSVVTLLHSRILGNSSTVLHNQLEEVHREEWLRKQLHYISDCQRHK